MKIKGLEPDDFTGEINFTIGSPLGSTKCFKDRYEKRILAWAEKRFAGVEKNLEYEVQKMDKNDYIWNITIRISA